MDRAADEGRLVRRAHALGADPARWDLVGDDDHATTQLSQPWMTTHSVHAVGVPLLRRGHAALLDIPFTSRLRVAGQPDVVLINGTQPSITLAPADPDTPPDLITDAAARVLPLWGRQPADTTACTATQAPNSSDALER